MQAGIANQVGYIAMLVRPVTECDDMRQG